MEEKIRTLATISANHFSANLDEVRLRTGRVTERIKIDHPEAAAIVAFPDAGHIIMVRQWRYAVGRETLEIPAGKADPGEALETCALRELHEETGYRGGKLVSLCRYFPGIGYSNEAIEIYASGGLTYRPEELDVDEIAKVEIVEIDKVFDLILNGDIQDGKTIIGVSVLRAKQARGEIPSDFFT